MKDPSRLLETTRDGLERELLRSAAGEVAPDAVRVRVLRSVNEALAATAGGARDDTGGTRSARGNGSSSAGGVQRALALKIVHAAYVGGLLATAAGVGLVILHGATAGSGDDVEQVAPGWSPAPARRASKAPSAPGARTELRRSSGLPAAAPSSRVNPGGALASTHSEHPRSSAGARNTPARSLADGSGSGTAGRQQEDWLGAQLQLLRQAREQLAAGRLEQAERVLDSYRPRFPGGVLGPQMDGLREELSERRVTRGEGSVRAGR